LRLPLRTATPDVVLDGEAFSASIAPLPTKYRLFQENRVLLAQPNCDVQSRVSVDSFRTFVGAIGGAEPDITDGNTSDPELLSDEFKFTTLSTAVADWWAVRPSSATDTRLITASLDERLQSHDQALCLHARKADRLHQAAIEGERANAARDIDLAVEQRRALGRDVCALEGEIRVLREAIATSGAKLKEDLVSVERQAKDGLRRSQERESQALADVRDVVGRLGAQLHVVVRY
jgi:hypothetical protein